MILSKFICTRGTFNDVPFFMWKGAVNMKFTKETLKRALRTFLQTAIAYIAVNIAVIDFTEKKAAESAVIGLIISAVAAGLAAVMNLEKKEG